MKTIIVIPARFKSSRFPGKPLIKLLGKPMIQWVAELSSEAVGSENVYIATDNNEIQAAVEQMGYNVVMTSEHCQTGTDRLFEVAKQIKSDIYINIQGDEPLINPEDIKKVVIAKEKYFNDVINAYTEIDKDEDVNNVNIPKVIFTDDKKMVYISRLPIPGFKEPINMPTQYYKQVCIYAYNRQELFDYGNYGKKSKLEDAEDIEIIRFHEWGQSIRLVKTRPGSLAVDIPEDVQKVEIALEKLNYE